MRNPFESLFSPIANGVIEKVKIAQRGALDTENFNVTNKKIAEYAIKIHKETISEMERIDYERLKKELEASTITTMSIEEFGAILKKIGIKSTQIKNTINHEKLHVKKAEERGGVNHGYICTIFKNTDSPTGYAVHVSVNIELPNISDQVKKDKILKEIILAVDQTETGMSEGDKEILSNIT